LLPIRSAAFAGFALGHDLVGVVFVPGVAALLAEQVGDGLDRGIGDVVLAALFAVERRDRHTPDALAGDAPVAAVAHHAGHPVVAPGRLPVYAVDGLVDVVAERIDRAEPLFGRTVDDRVVAAP